MHLLLLICLCLICSGCSTRFSEPSWPFKNGELCRGGGTGVETRAADGTITCNVGHVVDAYNSALEYCIQYSNQYEDGGDAINSSRFMIATLGTLSGAVFAPLAGGSAKDAWSGLSGSTNALQSALNESFSNAVNIRRRVEIAGAGATAKQQVASANENLTKVMAAMQLAYECRMAVARADGAAVQALSDLQSGGATVPTDKPVAVAKPEAAQIEAEAKAKVAATSAVTAAVSAPIPISATAAEVKEINRVRAAVADAAVESAATAAASAATQTTQQVTAAPDVAVTIEQTQVAAHAAAQVVAGTAAQAAAEHKATELLKGQVSTVVQQAVMQSTTSTAAIAAEAAAGAAAAAAAAPVQPLDAR